MGVHRLRVEPVEPRPLKSSPSETPEPPRPAPQEPPQAPPAVSGPDALDVVLAAFTGLGYALSARALLLLSIVGAFVLAVLVIQTDKVVPLIVLIGYCALVVIPLCILEYRRRES